MDGLITELREAIREELSIANEVKDKAYDLKEKILAELKNTPKKQSEIKGVTERSGCFCDDFNGVKLSITFVYYNFPTREALESANGKYDYNSCFSAKAGKNLWLLNIKFFGVSGGVNIPEMTESIQHEIGHIYQGKLGSAFITEPSVEYMTISDGLRSPDDNIRRISEILYISFPGEQDAFVNGLYSKLTELKIPVPKWEDVKDSEAYAWLIKARDNSKYFEERSGNEDLRKKCMLLYGKSLSQVIAFGKKSYDRIKRKMAKVLVKVRKDYAENHPPLMLNIKGETTLPYFEI